MSFRSVFIQRVFFQWQYVPDLSVFHALRVYSALTNTVQQLTSSQGSEETKATE